MDLVFARDAFLRFNGATNESLRLIIIILEQNNFARVTSDPKKPVKGSISAKLVIRTLFLSEATFQGFLELQMSPLDLL